jgi:dethiobiotin synthetase
VNGKGLFVTGTGTGVGKSVIAASIIASLSSQGHRVTPWKPVVSGTGQCDPIWPHDHELLARAAGGTITAEDVCTAVFEPPLSPHRAAALAGLQLRRTELLAHARAAMLGGDVFVAEGVGGLLVPLCEDYLVRDLAAELAFPLLIASQPGLGTINHTLLTVQAARAAGLSIAAIVMGPWPEEDGAAREAAANTQAIEQFCGISVCRIPRVAGPDIASLAQAGAKLPISEWLV